MEGLYAGHAMDWLAEDLYPQESESASWLGNDLKAKNMYFILFVVLLIIILIFNRYRAEDLIIEKKRLLQEVEILHSKYTKTQTNLMMMGTERKVAQDSTIIKMGLKLPERPPKLIIIKE